MSVKSVRLSILFLAFVMLLVACGESPNPSTPTTSTQSSNSNQPCAMIMATFYGSDPASPVAPLQAEIKTGLDAASVKVGDLSVEGWGEKCVGGGSSRDICCMRTPISISLQVGDLKDREALGDLLGKTLKVIYAAGDYRGGDMNVTFVSPKGESQLKFDGSKGREEFEQGLHGAALLDALGTSAPTP